MQTSRTSKKPARPFATTLCTLLALSSTHTVAAADDEPPIPPPRPIARQRPAPTDATPLALPAVSSARGDLPESTTRRDLTALRDRDLPDVEHIEPIDLASTLRLAGARDLDIAIARERVAQSMALYEQARVLWLPSLFWGPSWVRHDGQAQLVQGPVHSISKSTLFLGATAASGVSAFGPILSGGPAPTQSPFSIIRISDAIFEPLAARQVMDANRAATARAANDALLGASEAFFDLQREAGRIAIAREAAQLADELARLTESYARRGVGLEADHRRVLAERGRRLQEIDDVLAELEAASAELVRRVRLDPRIVVAPLEPPETIVKLFDDEAQIDDLILQALQARPELAEAQALVAATVTRLRQARMRPLIPSLAFQYSGGGFGGGTNAFFGDFGARSDVSVNLFWEVQNLGLGDRAIARGRAAEQRSAILEKLKTQDRVAAQVVAAERRRRVGTRRIATTSRAVDDALRSVALNFRNIREGAGLAGATRPIEVLQPIQALATARGDRLEAVLAYNRSQFELARAVGHAPEISSTTPDPNPPATPPTTEITKPAIGNLPATAGTPRIN